MAATARDLITPVDGCDADSFDVPPKWFVKYPEGVTDNYGQTGYYFRTLNGARYMARNAFRARPGAMICLVKDW